MPHLWEVKHDYYCSDNNYYSNECAQEYRGWARFIDEYGDADMDYNLVFRWDWKDANNPDYELKHDELSLFVIQQRKGNFIPITVTVCKDDERAVIEWLRPRMQHLIKLWEPIGGE